MFMRTLYAELYCCHAGVTNGRYPVIIRSDKLDLQVMEVRMNDNWHDVRQQLNRQLEIERKMARLRRQQKWEARKKNFESKMTALVAQVQFAFLRRADGTP